MQNFWNMWWSPCQESNNGWRAWEGGEECCKGPCQDSKKSCQVDMFEGPTFGIFILDFSRLIPFTFFAGRPRERQRLCTRWDWLRRRRWVSELAQKRENCCWLRGSSSRSGSLTSWSRELRWWTAVPNNPPSTLREVVLSLPLLPSCNLACFSPVLKEVQESDQLVVPWKPLTIIQNWVCLSSTNCNFLCKSVQHHDLCWMHVHFFSNFIGATFTMVWIWLKGHHQLNILFLWPENIYKLCGKPTSWRIQMMQSNSTNPGSTTNPASIEHEEVF